MAKRRMRRNPIEDFPVVSSRAISSARDAVGKAFDKVIDARDRTNVEYVKKDLDAIAGKLSEIVLELQGWLEALV